MLLRDLTIANICVQPDCQTSLRPGRRSSKGKTGWPAASKAVLSAPGRGFVHAIRQMPSEIRKIEKNRFRKAAATDSAISRTETYCLTLRLLLLSTRLPKIRSRRKRQSQLFLAAPSDFQYFSTALASCATPIHLDGFLTRVPPQAECNPLTSSGSTPAPNHRARQQTDHTRAHHPGATIPGPGQHIFQTIQANN